MESTMTKMDPEARQHLIPLVDRYSTYSPRGSERGELLDALPSLFYARFPDMAPNHPRRCIPKHEVEEYNLVNTVFSISIQIPV